MSDGGKLSGNRCGASASSKGISAACTADIRRESFPEGKGACLFMRALRFYWAARGHVRQQTESDEELRRRE